MKSNPSGYILGAGLIGLLLVGALITQAGLKPELPEEESETLVTISDPLYIGFDVELYSEDAIAIVVGSVKEVGKPYVRDDRSLISQQDVILDVEKVLKGDESMTQIKVLLEGEFPVATDENGKQSIVDENTPDSYSRTMISDEPPSFTAGESVLLFLWENSYGDFGVYGGPNGKFVIDQNNMVIDSEGTPRSLEDFEAEIMSALANPSSL